MSVFPTHFNRRFEKSLNRLPFFWSLFKAFWEGNMSCKEPPSPDTIRVKGVFDSVVRILMELWHTATQHGKIVVKIGLWIGPYIIRALEKALQGPIGPYGPYREGPIRPKPKSHICPAGWGALRGKSLQSFFGNLENPSKSEKREIFGFYCTTDFH